MAAVVRVSVRTVLVVATVGLTAMVIGVILWSWRTSSEQVVEEHALALLAEAADLGRTETEGYLLGAQEHLEVVVDLFEVSEDSLANTEDVTAWFAHQLSHVRAASAVFLGRPDGSFISVAHSDDLVPNGFRTRVIEVASESVTSRIVWSDSEFRPIDSRLDAPGLIDPVEQPWYRRAAAAGAIAWSDPYVLAGRQSPGVTASAPINRSNGAVVGVVGIDVELAGLAEFLQALKIREDSSAFVFDRMGGLIASSSGGSDLYRESDSGFSLPRMADLGDNRAAAAFDSLLDGHDELILTAPVFTDYLVGEERHHAYFVPLVEIPWILGVEVADEALVGSVRDGLRRSSILAIVIALIAAAFGLVVSRALSRPMAKLQEQALHALQGAPGPAPQVRSRFREIHEAADALTTSQRMLEARVRDRTRELEDQIVERREVEYRAIAASNAKSAFLGNMSHELRTPLNAVIGLAELIEREAYGPVGSARYKEFAADIVHAGSHLVDLIDEILDLTRIEAGALSLEADEVDVAHVIDSSVRLVEPLVHEKGIDLSVVVSSDLPCLLADRVRLRQVLVNLLSNAIKFTPAGGTISVTGALSAANEIRLTVEDTGIGMTAEDIEVALSLFGRVDGATARASAGVGIGLTLTAHIVEEHGGELSIQSRPGRGTSVDVRFPANRTIQTLDPETRGTTV